MTNFKKLFSDIPKKYNIMNIVFTTLFTLADAYISAVLSKMTGAFINNNISFANTVIFFIIFVTFMEISEMIGDCFIRASTTMIENNVFKNNFNKLYKTNTETLTKSNSGYIAGLLNKMISYKVRAYETIMAYGLLALIYSAFSIFYIGKFSIWFSVATLSLMLISLAIRLIANKITLKKKKEMSSADGKRTKIFMDAISNITTIQKLKSDDFINEKIEEANERCTKTTRDYFVTDEILFCSYKWVMFMICPVCLIVLILLGDNVNFNVVEFLTYISILEVKLAYPVRGIGNAIRDFGLWTPIQKQIDDIESHKNSLMNKETLKDNFEYIEIKNAVYKYNVNKKKSVVVKIPYFKLKKGDIVSVSGESGQGKTTTLNLLSGMIDNDFVYVNGKPINKNIDAVFISQDIEIFDMSLRDNLTLGKNISDETLYEMLETVGLGGWVKNIDGGLDVILGERGVFVSTGQRQRLNLIRGLLIDNKEIYLLDEPTSNVDTRTEEKMIRLIQEKLKGKTVVIVTHREKIKEICNKNYIFKNSVLQKLPNE